ncbi:PQQ-dependent dehydrogenase, methanol/ethanol family [Phenylobacterium montanum]|uniref:PQQ-dependent dehydrogenase, methanol/ethanol family n=1 Tax=Phenylobacterium montanum TaxID=2823693 RepID=A0A975G3D9_9CAUL|nr:PQQ-dependent dehydrogenase, methanol/ethanol family [Caulobacter sp. S6]QUD89276.1 PQQ-dependent dehydrogenase, methanol/ethanol family [Caulobacter sp. S6]
MALVALAAATPLWTGGAFAAGGVPAPLPQQAGNVGEDRLKQADSEPQNWFTGGRDSRQTYHSPLAAINDKTVGRLGFAWSYDLGTHRGQEATPIVVDGVMYTSGYKGLVYALNAETGVELWRFDPDVPDIAYREPCCDTVNRGVAVWKGKVYVASVDGRIHALDAATGKEIWSADTITDHRQPYSSTGAPVIAHDVVVIGNGGADMEKGGVRGYVSGYDLDSGKLKWRFFTVPPAPGARLEHPELVVAARSWGPHRAAVYAGGATAWDGMTYDPETNLVYIGTGNAAPYDLRKLGKGNGDDLFACSILAIDPDTGRMAWYYQTTPGDHWDFDAVQKLVVADLPVAGKPRHVVMQASKNGFFYVLDARSGKLVSADPYTYVNWAKAVDMKTGRPEITTQADYYKHPKNIYPSWSGGHTWPPMSFNPQTGLVYIPVIDVPNIWVDMEHNGGRVKYVNGFFSIEGFFPDENYSAADLKSLYGTLPELKQLQSERSGKLVRELIRAWDPVSQKVVWEHETSSGVRGYDGGVLSTNGNLVIQGRGSGQLFVYAADTGRVLKTIDTGSHIMAAPMTYAVNGVQYVAVQTGYGGAAITVGPIPASSAASRFDNENRILAFKLDGGETPKPAPRPQEPFPAPPPSKASLASIRRGEVKFTEQCSRCHALGPSVTPDLRKLSPQMHQAFEDIVLHGVAGPLGMERFDDLLKPADVKAIHAYLIDQQKQGYQAQLAAARK